MLNKASRVPIFSTSDQNSIKYEIDFAAIADKFGEEFVIHIE